MNQRIGKYIIESLIAEGGMAKVYAVKGPREVNCSTNSRTAPNNIDAPFTFTIEMAFSGSLS